MDDGHPDDLKAAELLGKHGLKATFYIPAKNPEREVIGAARIREVARGFEVAGHTLNHVPLNQLKDAAAFAEISDGKKWLEDVIGGEVVSFCYPRGKFRSSTAALVKKAGFLGARNSMYNRCDWPSDPFHWGLSTHAYSHPVHVQLRHALFEGNLKGAANYLGFCGVERDWECHFMRVLEHVGLHGGIAHLFFHSWEITERGDWKKLDRVLAHAAVLPCFERVTNGELFRMWADRRPR